MRKEFRDVIARKMGGLKKFPQFQSPRLSSGGSCLFSSPGHEGGASLLQAHDFTRGEMLEL